jgi:hypothetical protein
MREWWNNWSKDSWLPLEKYEDFFLEGGGGMQNLDIESDSVKMLIEL